MMNSERKPDYLPDQYIEQLSTSIYRTESAYLTTYHGYHLSSAFQPIFSLAHKRIVGYEALIRSHDADNQSISPSKLFASESKGISITQLDRLCRMLHLKNFEFVPDPLNWLFLNVSPQIISAGKSYGSFFNNLLKATGFPPHRIVMEIVEHPIIDQEALKRTVEYYKEMGCLIAIDDFGTGHSNFERIWALEPEIVKLDQSMVAKATEQKRIRQLLPEIVDLLHQAGSLVLMEGIETTDQAMIAMECDVDFVQGYYFTRPTTDYSKLSDKSQEFSQLFQRYKEENARKEDLVSMIFNRYHHIINQTVQSIQQGQSFEKSCAGMVDDDLMIRCYLLHPSGLQIGNTLVCESYSKNEDQRFAPIQSGKSADWFRRHYLKTAVAHPEQLQITQPYLSITGAHMCLTLSMMFPSIDGNRVFCCDLNWF